MNYIIIKNELTSYFIFYIPVYLNCNIGEFKGFYGDLITPVFFLMIFCCEIDLFSLSLFLLHSTSSLFFYYFFFSEKRRKKKRKKKGKKKV